MSREQPTRDQIREALHLLPLSERASMLMLSVMERDTNPLRSLVALIKTTMVMAGHLGMENRRRLAAGLRVAADDLEQPARSIEYETHQVH